MVDYYSVSNYSPFNMNSNYGYNKYPMFKENVSKYGMDTINNTNYLQPQSNFKSDVVTFSTDNQLQTDQHKQQKQLSTGAKIAIGAGVTTALAVGADFLFCKGKHVKSLFGKNTPKSPNNGTKPNNTTPKSTNTNTTKSSPSKPQATTSNNVTANASLTTSNSANATSTGIPRANTTLFDGKSSVNISDYTPAQQRAREFTMQEDSIFSHGRHDDKYLHNISPEEIYQNAVALKYQNIRSAKYPTNARYNQNIDRITGTTTNNITVNNQNCWNYRISKAGTFKDKTIDRISLNVYPEEQLITSLDKYFATGKIKGYYKTPDRLQDWGLRHDPITIYLQEPINQNIIDDIVKISKPHIRSTENVLIGKTVSPGVAIDKSPSTQDLVNLIQEARQYDEILAHQLETSKKYGFARNPMYGDYTLQSSAGQVAAVRALLDAMAKTV